MGGGGWKGKSAMGEQEDDGLMCVTTFVDFMFSITHHFCQLHVLTLFIACASLCVGLDRQRRMIYDLLICFLLCHFRRKTFITQPSSLMYDAPRNRTDRSESERQSRA